MHARLVRVGVWGLRLGFARVCFTRVHERTRTLTSVFYVWKFRRRPLLSKIRRTVFAADVINFNTTQLLNIKHTKYKVLSWHTAEPPNFRGRFTVSSYNFEAFCRDQRTRIAGSVSISCIFMRDPLLCEHYLPTNFQTHRRQ